MNAPCSIEVNRRWVHVAIGTGFLASAVYPIMVFVPMPRPLTVFVAASFGPALAFASLGLHRFLALDRETVAAQAAAIANVVAGALVTAMLLVQLQLRFGRADARQPAADEAAISAVFDRIWDVVLGLDVAFDVFIGIATVLFGIAMLRHPAFGRVMGATGLAIGAVLILGFNLSTLPRLPRDSGLFDPGPVTGAWYLVATILVVRGRRWMEARLQELAGPSGG